MNSDKFSDIIIASDIDGTFVDGARVPERNTRAVEYFNSRGGMFSFSSGRNHRDIGMIIPEIKKLASIPCVLCNGSMLYDVHTDEISNPICFDKTVAEPFFCDIIETFPEIFFRITADVGFLVPENARAFRSPSVIRDIELARTHGYLDFEPLENLKNAGGRWYKAVFIAPPETLAPLMKYCADAYSDRLSFTSSAPTLFEVVPKGVSKSVQLAHLRDTIRLTRPNAVLYCIGDYMNDYEMLRLADIAVCPENACDEIKRISKIRVCSNKEGAVGHLIELLDSRLA